MTSSPPVEPAVAPVSARNNAWRRGVRRSIAILGLAWVCLAAQAETPGNFYRADTRMPGDLQRVLLLPLTAESDRAELTAGCESLEQVLQAELAKTRQFEVIRAAPGLLRSQTGRAAWSAGDTLPTKFFSALREAYGCDAVLFCELTAFKAYTPLAVGWRLRLVDARSQQTLWASDEVFDAAERAIQEDARRHERQGTKTWSSRKPSDWLVLHSPRRFGQFTLATVLATLPRR